jgi:hypothetical protein
MFPRGAWGRGLYSALVALAALVLGACGAGSRDEDPEADDTCLECHALEGVGWQQPSSHRLLFACADCHPDRGTAPGLMHRQDAACTSCHSEERHLPAGSCTTCHAAHGSPNLFLIRERIELPDGRQVAIDFTVAAGADAHGLARAGVPGEQAGGGLCEVCHTTTAHYTADGQATPHSGAWCGTCHDHQRGFAPADP